MQAISNTLPNDPIRVLAIDDEPAICLLIERILASEPDLIGQCTDNAEEALEIARQFDPDVIVTDIAMPIMDGFTLSKRMLEIDSTFQPLVISGHLHGPEDAAKGMDSGIVGYIDKPFSPQDLLINVRACGRSRRRWLAQKEELAALHLRMQETCHQLSQVEKMASIGQLISGVAHDISNPLSYVSSNLKVLGQYGHTFTEALKGAAKVCEAVGLENWEKAAAETKAFQERARQCDLQQLQEDQSALLQETLAGLQQIQETVHNLKDFARTDGTEREPADLHAGLEATLKILASELKGVCRIERHYGSLPDIHCTPGQINQVFMNLLLNAGQALGDDGVIELHTAVEEDQAVIRICDNGAGIPKEQLEQIFDPFFTTKHSEQGTGLGLAVSKGIIESHGGEISVESTIDQGTTFSIRLPLTPPCRGLSHDV